MFYSEGVLARKGPLARVWLAAHWERKLTKAQFLQTNIDDCIGAIIGGDQPPLALRLTGQLLLGVVKIYSRKTRYLIEDCHEAAYKIKTTFRPSDVDLRDDQVTANIHAITLPDAVNELDILMPDLDVNFRPWDPALDPAAAQTISRAQDITLRESSMLLSPVGFSKTGLFNPDLDIAGVEDAHGFDFDLGLDVDGAVARSTPQQTREQADETSPMDVEVGRDAMAEQPFVPDIGGGGSVADKTFEGDGGMAEFDPLFPVEHEPPAFENVELELGISSSAFDNEPSAVSMSRISLPLGDSEDNVLFDVPEPTVGEVEEEDYETPSGRKSIPKKRRLMIDETTQLSETSMKRHLTDTSDITGKLSFLPFSKRKWRLENLTVEYYLDCRPREVAEELRSLFDLPSGKDYHHFRPPARERLENDEAVVPSTNREESAQPAEVAVRRESRILEDFDANFGDNTADFSFAGEPADGTRLAQEFLPSEEGLPTRKQTENLLVSPVIGGPSDISPITPAAASEDKNKLSFYDSGDLNDASQLDSGLQQLDPGTSRGVLGNTALKAVGLLRDEFAVATNAGHPAELSYKALSSGARRGEAARLFYEVLLLATKDVIGVSQDEAYGDITIRAKNELFGITPTAAR